MIMLRIKKWKSVIKINNLFYSLSLLIPVFYTLSELLKLNISNRLILIYTILLLLFMHKKFMTHTKAIKLIIFDMILLFYVLIRGFSSIFEFDFYCYVLYAEIFLVFTEPNILSQFYKYYVDKYNFFCFRTIVVFLCVLISVFFFDGLYASFGSSIPVLYGPFTLPHVLGYMLICIYCEASIYNQIKQSNINLIVKFICVLACIWTAARSAVLGIIIVVFYDYYRIKKINKKMMIFLSVISIFVVILIFNSELILNNPLIQKTISAKNSGSISSGREIFISIAKNTFNNLMNFQEKVFGIGLDSVRNIMYSTIGVRIHIHNDYYNMLIGYGISGLIIFVALQLRVRFVCRNKAAFLFCTILIISLAYFNGFALYSLIVISSPIIFIFFEKLSLKQVKIE